MFGTVVTILFVAFRIDRLNHAVTRCRIRLQVGKQVTAPFMIRFNKMMVRIHDFEVRKKDRLIIIFVPGVRHVLSPRG